MSKYIENKNRYLKLQQKGGNDPCMVLECQCKNSRYCECKDQVELFAHDHKHGSIRHELDNLVVERALLHILGDMYSSSWAVQIAIIGDFSLALLNDGTLVAWTVDPGDAQAYYLPDEIQKHVVNIVASRNSFFVALLDNNSICILGKHQHVMLRDFKEKRITQITSGYKNLLVLFDDGTVREWYIGGEMRRVRDTVLRELRVPSNLYVTLEETDAKIIQIASGYHFSMGLLNNGTVKMWEPDSDVTMEHWIASRGIDWMHQDDAKIIDIPNFIPGQVIQIVAYDRHAIAVLDDGTITAWGSDDFGVISMYNNLSPELSKLLLDVKQIAYKNVLLNDGTVVVLDKQIAYKNDGKVVVLDIQMDIPDNMRDIIQGKVVQIAYGFPNCVVVLLNDGTVAGWHLDWDGAHRTRNIPEEIRAQ